MRVTLPKLKALLAWGDMYPVEGFAFFVWPQVCRGAQPAVGFVRASERYRHQLAFLLNFLELCFFSPLFLLLCCLWLSQHPLSVKH